MSSYTQLATEIIILITALVGLYKISTTKPEGLDGVRLTPGWKMPEMLKLIGVYAGVYAFMLVPVIFIGLFMLILNLINSPTVKHPTQMASSSLSTNIDANQLSGKGRLAYAMLHIGLLEEGSEKDETLKKASEMGIESQSFVIALTAAQDIENSYERDQQLSRIAQAATYTGQLNFAINSIESMDSDFTKSNSLKQLMISIENWNNHLKVSK